MAIAFLAGVLAWAGVAAVDAVLAGQPVPAEQKGSVGCNIKWKRGNAPEYF